MVVVGMRSSNLEMGIGGLGIVVVLDDGVV